MSRFPFLTRILTAFVFLVVVQVQAPALAQPAKDIIDGWFQDMKDAGAKVAEYDAIRFDTANDTAIIENMRLEWHLQFPEAEYFADIKMTAGVTAMVGLREEADGFRMNSYTISDDYKLEISGVGERQEPFVVTGTIVGMKAENMFFPRFTVAPEDPQRPVSRYMHYYDLFLKSSVAKSVIDKMVVESSANGQPLFVAEYEGVVTEGMQNGRVEESRIKSYRQVSYAPKSTDPNAPQAPDFGQMESTYGAMVQRGIDMRVLVEGLTASGAGPDGDYKVFMDETSVASLKMQVGPASFSMDDYTVRGMKVKPGEKNLLDVLDRAMLGNEPNEKEGMILAFDIMRRFAMDEWSISGLKGNGPDNISGSMTRTLISNVSNAGLGKFEISGIDFNGPGGEKVSFDVMSIGKVLFPKFEDIVAAIENGPPQDPIKAAALGPKIGEIRAANVLVDDKKRPAFSLGLFEVLQSGFIGPIPTALSLQAKDLNLPVDYVEDPLVQSMLRSMGYSVLKIAANIVLNWEESSQDLTLQTADLSLENGGQVSLKAGVAGLPKSVIEDPNLFQQALATLAFRNASLSVKDAALISGLIDQFAQQQGMPAADLREALIQGVDGMAGPLAGSPFVEQVKTALRAFMANPERLAVDLSPNAPVPITQILGVAATAPAQAPELLGATISAN